MKTEPKKTGRRGRGKALAAAEPAADAGAAGSARAGAAAVAEEAARFVPQPAAEALIRGIVDRFLAETPAARKLAAQMRDLTGTRFFDWIDHVTVPRSEELRRALLEAGFTEREASEDAGTPFVHEGAVLPAVLLADTVLTEVAVKVESAADFAAAHCVQHRIDGPPAGPYRHLVVERTETTRLSVVERHGYRGYSPLEAAQGGHGSATGPFTAENAIARMAHLEVFRARPRECPVDREPEMFEQLHDLLDAAIAEIGRDATCDLFFAAEREYWQRRNRAARVQKVRQDLLGLGWANHDHHTYRSSRRHFARLVALWEKLGFVCRERFYAGREAGWGAQVMEHPTAGIVTFNDVDLSPDELVADFAHEGLEDRQELGTIGLWCALHGESVLQAGMHHLEAQFDFEALRAQLEREAGVRTMKPFTDLPYLKQAFTEGERWPVGEDRIARLLAAGQITPDQAARFRSEGALGSHLEDLQRDAGFKGFNQQGVSQIIAETDPRR